MKFKIEIANRTFVMDAENSVTFINQLNTALRSAGAKSNSYGKDEPLKSLIVEMTVSYERE